LRNIFAEEIKNKTISQSLINQLTKDINRVGERFSNRTDQDIILKDKSLGEIIVDQLEYEAETERQYYRTIVAKKTGKTDLQQITDPEYASLFRTNTLNRISKDLGSEFVMRFLAPGTSAPSKTGKGEFIFTGLNTYERNPNYDPTSTNRKGVTEGAADTAMVFEGQDVDVAPQPSIATKGNLTFDDINSKVKPNLERVVKFQQENNQAFRDVVDWLKTNYENVEVCYDDQKYVKLNMKSSIGVSPGFITLIVKKANEYVMQVVKLEDEVELCNETANYLYFLINDSLLFEEHKKLKLHIKNGTPTQDELERVII
jgi:hypothetical protein